MSNEPVTRAQTSRVRRVAYKALGRESFASGEQSRGICLKNALGWYIRTQGSTLEVRDNRSWYWRQLKETLGRKASHKQLGGGYFANGSGIFTLQHMDAPARKRELFVLIQRSPFTAARCAISGRLSDRECIFLSPVY